MQRGARLGVVVVAVLAATVLAGQQTSPSDPLWDRRATGAGAFQTVFEVSGRMELSIHRVSSNPQDLTSICSAQSETEAAALDAAQRDLKRLLAAPSRSREPEDLAWAYRTLGQMYAYQGEMASSGEAFDKAHETIAPLVPANPALREATHLLDLSVAVANLRRGELENCLTDHNAERCIFPISRRGVHQHQSGSTRAVEFFTRALAHDPKNLETRWLLNVAFMTLGKYPDEVPADTLIRVADDEADAAPRFTDVAHESGLPLRTRAGGAIIDDFDNDGLFDIVVSSLGPCDPLRLYHNAGGGRFEDVSERARVLDQTGGINISHADFDNDGWLDIYVHRGGWEYPMRNSLLRNNHDGTFTDVTGPAGLLDKRPHRTHTAAWADYDNDGWVDLFVGHEESPSALYHNERDGTFREVGASAGVARTAFTKGATWGDYDNDGFADLYVSNYAGRNFLFHNRKDGTFDEVAQSLGVDLPLMSFATWFFDYDNDGGLDLFVTSFVPSVTEVVRGVMGLAPQAETMRLYRNNRKGGFEDVTAASGLARVVPAMGANFGDVDNDGFLDMYIGTGAPSYAALIPNVLLRNDGGRRFRDATAASGTGHLQKGHGVAFGDVDGDGDDDLLANMGGFVPGDAYWKALFRNPGTTNRSIGVRLVGSKSNRAGIGARLTAFVRQPDGTLAERHRVVTSGGSFGASPYTQRIGMGPSSSVERLDVVWPASGVRQSFAAIAAGQTIEIREDRSAYRRLDGSASSGAIR